MDISQVKEILNKTEKEYDEVVKEKENLENNIKNAKREFERKQNELRIKYEKLLELEMNELKIKAKADINSLKEQQRILDYKELALLDKSERFANVYLDNYYKSMNKMEWVTDIPKTSFGYTNEDLLKYSVLNVDEIGNIICYLLKKEEGKTFTSKRVQTISSSLDLHVPYLAIREEEKNNADYYKSSQLTEIASDPDDSSIIIGSFYPGEQYMRSYPTDHPFITYRGNNIDEIQTNYKQLLSAFYGDLDFNYKDHEIVRELIYSLANYQSINNIKWMSAKDTKETFKKLYKSR